MFLAASSSLAPRGGVLAPRGASPRPPRLARASPSLGAFASRRARIVASRRARIVASGAAPPSSRGYGFAYGYAYGYAYGHEWAWEPGYAWAPYVAKQTPVNVAGATAEAAEAADASASASASTSEATSSAASADANAADAQAWIDAWLASRAGATAEAAEAADASASASTSEAASSAASADANAADAQAWIDAWLATTNDAATSSAPAAPPAASPRASPATSAPEATREWTPETSVTYKRDVPAAAAAPGPGPDTGTAPPHWVATLTNAFPLWVLAFAVLGLACPPAVTWFRGDAITLALAGTMLGMGLTLDVDAFVDACARPGRVALGVALQYTIMPTLGLLIGKLFPVSPAVAVGLILVGCCPGGTASNVVTFLARANVALSVVLTTVSTLLASFATPLMTKTLAGAFVPVDAVALCASTTKVVLVPVFAGVALRKYAPDAVALVAPYCPLFAVATVALICGSVIGSSAAAIQAAGPALLAAVCTLHCAGFALGYAASRGVGFAEADARTVSVEVGMQNSALGVVLATAHFADPMVAVPCAVSATVHSCVGSGIAGWWRARGGATERQGGAN